jgi:hypothetical protein
MGIPKRSLGTRRNRASQFALEGLERVEAKGSATRPVLSQQVLRGLWFDVPRPFPWLEGALPDEHRVFEALKLEHLSDFLAER